MDKLTEWLDKPLEEDILNEGARHPKYFWAYLFWHPSNLSGKSFVKLSKPIRYT